MRRYLLAAVAAAAIATPALARDGQPYVGIEGGILFPEDLDLDINVLGGPRAGQFDNGLTLELGEGFDVDVIAGNDFGFFRIEAELGYKRISVNEAVATSAAAQSLNLANTTRDIAKDGRVLSLMANALVDVGDENGFSAYVGGGFGRAKVKFSGSSDGAFAYQFIGGVRYAVSENIDLGLKYRYFRTRELEIDNDFASGPLFFGLDSRGKLRTHSVLASLTYNFGAPPVVIAPVIVEPVIAPPPPPPATQTCYDGSVILATDICPQPPVPEPAPERG